MLIFLDKGSIYGGDDAYGTNDRMIIFPLSKIYTIPFHITRHFDFFPLSLLTLHKHTHV